MKKLFFIPILFLLNYSCTPDGQFDSYTNDSAAVDSFGVDTFSVSQPKILTDSERIQIALDKKEVDSIVNDASNALHQSDPENTKKSPDAICTNYDIGPSFPGGGDAMDSYILKHRIYPLVAFQSEIKGTVRLKVVIERDGKIGGIEVLQGIGYGCDESAIDLIRGMPKWIPGKKDGMIVRCAIIIPISFGD